MLGDAARDDAAVMVELRIDVECDAMIGHPAPHAHADRGDLFLASAGPRNPDADAAVAPLTADAELRERADHPLLEPVHVAAHIAIAAGEIEHDIGDALPGPVIGVAAAAAGPVHRQVVRVEQVLRACAGPGSVERRVLEQPNELGCRTLADRRDPCLHLLDRGLVIDGNRVDPPLDLARSRYHLKAHAA